MNSSHDHVYMARAIQMARRGFYTTHPNPRVGCVIVRDGEIVGEGAHLRAGEGHAEVNALANAGDKAKGAEVYVTLEPCSHYGRTPPCSQALIDAGVKRVVSAMEDPNPEVAGKGIKLLNSAGIETVTGVMQAEAESLNPGFLKRMRTGKPFVRSKIAMSLDGRTAMASGESKWITSVDARLDVQRLRASSDAILTGIETVLKDDPSLNIRLDELPIDIPVDVPQPLRVIVDSHLRMQHNAKMLSLDGKTMVFTTSADKKLAEKLENKGASVVTVQKSNSHVALSAVLDYLAQQQINEVLVEAGSTLNGALLQAGLIDELVIYVAPKLMGDNAKGLFHLPVLAKMSESVELNITDIRSVGKDFRITATVEKP
ncbi:MAG: bifunctional diaminohydroxyphosphoribosylaminopyrimidine deaminase/5-amino-6-(5-phosphoribosylamino)uracil reductase RibD [Gammaproteobacteria bacterium]|nr:bifunctional diaminohydroxyphosphoribosylaminopyrimidine deaminase/5-amino-6-(5-phosphoribosylamino)uracil reductase RibD [Gammaproteobacteria bacterium]